MKIEDSYMTIGEILNESLWCCYGLLIKQMPMDFNKKVESYLNKLWSWRSRSVADQSELYLNCGDHKQHLLWPYNSFHCSIEKTSTTTEPSGIFLAAYNWLQTSQTLGNKVDQCDVLVETLDVCKQAVSNELIILPVFHCRLLFFVARQCQNQYEKSRRKNLK